MRAAFLGTPTAAVPSLTALADIADVGLVVTRPDSARGRSGRKQPSAVKVAAAEFGFEVAQPASGGELRSVLQAHRLDFAVVVAYGRLLGPKTLATTRYGFLNVHFSLLPRWRGAAPVERSILAGDEVTGVSLMLINEGLDTGPVISIVETAIDEDETGGSLTARLAYLGADMVARSVPEFLAGRRDPAPQINVGAMPAHPLTTAEAQIEPTEEVEVALRKIRAYNPRPGAWLSIGGKRLKVWRSGSTSEEAGPGVIRADGDTPVLGLSDGAITLELVQAEGKSRVDGASWMRGRQADEVLLDPPQGQLI